MVFSWCFLGIFMVFSRYFHDVFTVFWRCMAVSHLNWRMSEARSRFSWAWKMRRKKGRRRRGKRTKERRKGMWRREGCKRIDCKGVVGTGRCRKMTEGMKRVYHYHHNNCYNCYNCFEMMKRRRRKKIFLYHSFHLSLFYCLMRLASYDCHRYNLRHVPVKM